MDLITIEEFDLTHSAQNVSEEEFSRLSQRAWDLTDELTFGRAERNEPEARRAMKEMISYWISSGDPTSDGVSGTPKSERIGNYSVIRREEKVLTVHGVPVSPTALLILNRAGLRDHGV